MRMMDRPLRVGVIGVGVMGERHARALAELPQTTLVAVVDVNPETAARVGAAHGVAAYHDYRDLLAREKLDAVVVATADQYHRDPTVDALRQGLAVFLEKPVASTWADAQAIWSAAQETGGRVMVGHTLRYDTRYAATAQAAREGKLGDIIHIYARRNATTWSGRRLGGRATPAVFQGVHDYDVIRWVTGAEITRVYAVSVSKALTDLKVPDTTVATLHLANGAVAIVEESWAVPYGVPSLLDARLEVIGTQGAAYVDMTPQGLSLYVDGKFTQPDTIYTAPGLHILKDMYHRFIAYINGRAEAVATLQDGMAALKIALAVDESARLGRPVDLA